MPLNTWNSTKVLFPSSAGLATIKMRWRASRRPRFSKPSKQWKRIWPKKCELMCNKWNFSVQRRASGAQALTAKRKAKSRSQKSQFYRAFEKETIGIVYNPKIYEDGLVSGDRWEVSQYFQKVFIVLKVKFDLLQEFFFCRPRSDLENIQAFQEKRKKIWVEEKKGRCFSQFWDISSLFEIISLNTEFEDWNQRLMAFGWGSGLGRRAPGFRGRHSFYVVSNIFSCFIFMFYVIHPDPSSRISKKYGFILKIFWKY